MFTVVPVLCLRAFVCRLCSCDLAAPRGPDGFFRKPPPFVSYRNERWDALIGVETVVGGLRRMKWAEPAFRQPAPGNDPFGSCLRWCSLPGG
jgi:hypothetical protein